MSNREELGIKLMEAIDAKDAAAFDKALEDGADINVVLTQSFHPMLGVPESIQYTPLKRALSNGDSGMIIKVLEAGADMAQTKKLLGKEFIAQLVDDVPSMLKHHPESTQKLKPLIDLFLVLGEPANPICDNKESASANIYNQAAFARSYEKTPQMATTWHARVVGAADGLSALGYYLKDVATGEKPTPAQADLEAEGIHFDFAKRQESIRRIQGSEVATGTIVPQGPVKEGGPEIQQG